MKEIYLGQINDSLDYEQRSWSDFLVQDCKDFIDTLHIYRLQHLLENIEGFTGYMDILMNEYKSLQEDETLEPQAQATVQAMFTLSCVEFVSASKERMLIRSEEFQQNQIGLKVSE